MALLMITVQTGSIRHNLKTKFILVFVYVISTSNSNLAIAKESVRDEQSTHQNYIFDPNALFGGKSQSVNLDNFTYTNTFSGGSYHVELYVNDRSQGNVNVTFQPSQNNDSPELCVNNELLTLLNIKKNLLDNIPSKDCYSLKDFDSNAFYEFDHNTLKLIISLPLAIVEYHPNGYIPFEKFDKGISSAFVGYDLNTNTSKFNETDRTDSLFLNLKGGINWNGFNFRHAGSFSTNELKLNTYKSYLNTVSTDILPIHSRLTLGDFYTQTYDISSAYIRGVQLATDLSMRPSSQQSYAPVIQGIAQSNALVTIFQDSQKIYERNVPIGNFIIQDLNTVSNGDLTVQITESNGEKSSFIVPNQGSFNLIRLNQFNYNFALGRYHLNQQLTDDYLSQLSFEYGLTNFISMFAGSNISQPFQNYLLGLSTNTKFGGLKFSIDSTHAELLDQQFTGHKYKTSYQYKFKNSKTSLTLNALHQTQKYMSLNNTMSLKNYEYLNETELENLFRTLLLKQQFDISIYQHMPKKYGSLYLNATRSKYWNSSDTYSQYQLGYSNAYKNFNYSLGFTKTYNFLNNKNDENRIYFSLSIPLDWNRKTVFINSNIQHSNQPKNNFTTSLGASTNFGEQSQGNFGLSHSHTSNQSKNQNTFSANLGYNFPQAKLATSATWNNNFYQYGLNTSGAFVLHQYGLTATNDIPETYAIIHVKDVSDASIVNGWGIKTDHFGNAIYSNLSPYRPNEISIDVSNLPVSLQLNENQMTVIPRKYSSTLIKVNVTTTSNLILEVETDNDLQIPLGLQVKNNKNEIVGIFGQSNHLFIENLELADRELLITWGDNSSYQCKIQLPNDIKIQESKVKDSFQIIRTGCI